MATLMVIPERRVREKKNIEYIKFNSLSRARRYIKRNGGRLKLVPKLTRTVKR